MANLAIKGHATRGSEVIGLLEMLGGEVMYQIKNYVYFIDEDKIIRLLKIDQLLPEEFIVFTLEEFLEKFPYKVGDKVKAYDRNLNDWVDTEITRIRWFESEVLYDATPYHNLRVNDLQPYKEETMEEKNEKSVNHVFSTEIISFDIAQKDKYELDLQGKFHVVLREGKYYVERIKPQYPKTYVECAKILNCFGAAHIDGYKCELLEKFQELLICRDAYWKIAGGQMRLGKPWEPDYNEESYEQGSPIKYVIYYTGTHITKERKCTPSYILSFPTEEMRDIFFEKFKGLIEQCKELL